MEEERQGNWPGLADDVVTILRCISCEGEVRQKAGGVGCADCGREYLLVKGIPRFVEAEHYAGSFGFQWHIFRKTQLDNENSPRSEKDFERRTGLTCWFYDCGLEDLRVAMQPISVTGRKPEGAPPMHESRDREVQRCAE